MMPSDLLSMEVPCEVRAPGMVRHALTAVFDGGWSLDDGLLIVSELVTNAVRHSGCISAHCLRVDVGHHGDNLVISVHDPGISGRDAEPTARDYEGDGGRGLRIVEQLSVRWGTERPDGYYVWAELAGTGPDR